MKKRSVRFKETPKVLRLIRVSFTVNGKRVNFTKAVKAPKRINVKIFRSSIAIETEEVN